MNPVLNLAASMIAQVERDMPNLADDDDLDAINSGLAELLDDAELTADEMASDPFEADWDRIERETFRAHCAEVQRGDHA